MLTRIHKTNDSKMVTKMWEDILKMEFDEYPILIHVDDHEALVIETKNLFFKILKLGLVQNEQVPEKTNYELCLNLHFMNNPHHSIGSPDEIFLLYNTYLDKQEHFAIFKLTKFTILHNLKCSEFTQDDKQVLCEQLHDGVKQIHSIGYYHGDLKPLNIGYKDGMKILDFGSANLVTTNDFTNSFGFCAPIQMLRWIISKDYKYKKYKTSVNIVKKLIEKKIIKKEEKTLHSKECPKQNDLFTVALLFVYIFGNGMLFFDPEGSKDFVNAILKNYEKFLENPEEYTLSIITKINPTKWVQSRILEWILDAVKPNY